MESILITGCNRGLGLGLIRQLTKQQLSPKKIIATCRNVEQAQELQNLAKQHNNLHILPLDVQKVETFPSFYESVAKIVGDSGLNVLFNNAGQATKSTRINFVKTEHLVDMFAVNTVGPIMLTKTLLPLLKIAAGKNKELSMGSAKAAVLNMSSVLASVTLNTDGGFYPYRCSKTALNIASKSLSVDLKPDGILVVCIHPGWVKTELGGSNAPMSVESSCASMVKLIFDLSEKQHGRFIQWNGKELPW